MSTMTRAALMSQAGLAAGNTQASAFVRTWLDAWLQRTAKTWSWPCLKMAISNVPVTTGSIVATLGNGSGGVTPYLHKLLNGVVFWRVQTGYSPNGRAFIRPIGDTDPSTREELIDPSKGRGKPETVKVRMGDVDTPGQSPGVLRLYFDKPTDVPLYLSFDAHVIPAAIGPLAANDTTKPWYPSDRTLIQACKCANLEIDAGGEQDPAHEAEMMKLAAMVVDDRDFDGEQAGDNQLMALDPSVFR